MQVQTLTSGRANPTGKVGYMRDEIGASWVAAVEEMSSPWQLLDHVINTLRPYHTRTAYIMPHMRITIFIVFYLPVSVSLWSHSRVEPEQIPAGEENIFVFRQYWFAISPLGMVSELRILDRGKGLDASSAVMLQVN